MLADITVCLFVAGLLLPGRVLPSRGWTAEDELDWNENQRRKP